MSWFVYIRKDRAYIPTSADTVDGIVIGVEPIEIADIDDTAALGSAVRAVIDRGRSVITKPPRDAWKNDPILALAGVKTWSAFYKGVRQLCFMRRDTGFEIVRLKPYERGFQTDEATRIQLPADLPLSQVVGRIVKEIQEQNRGPKQGAE